MSKDEYQEEIKRESLLSKGIPRKSIFCKDNDLQDMLAKEIRIPSFDCNNSNKVKNKSHNVGDDNSHIELINLYNKDNKEDESKSKSILEQSSSNSFRESKVRTPDSVNVSVDSGNQNEVIESENLAQTPIKITNKYRNSMSPNLLNKRDLTNDEKNFKRINKKHSSLELKNYICDVKLYNSCDVNWQMNHLNNPVSLDKKPP